jgi:hypothetical protein
LQIRAAINHSRKWKYQKGASDSGKLQGHNWHSFNKYRAREYLKTFLKQKDYITNKKNRTEIVNFLIRIYFFWLLSFRFFSSAFH